MSVHHSKGEGGHDAKFVTPLKKPETTITPADVADFITALTPPNSAAAAAPAITRTPSLEVDAMTPGTNPMSTAALPSAATAATATAAAASTATAAAAATGDSADAKVVPPTWDLAWTEKAFQTAERIAGIARVEAGRVQVTTSLGATGDALLRSLVHILGVDGFAPASKQAGLQGQCARALGNLCMQDDNRIKVLGMGGLKALLNRLKTSTDGRVNFYLCGCAGNLCVGNRTVQEAMIEAGAIPLLGKVLKAFRSPESCLMVIRACVQLCEHKPAQVQMIECGLIADAIVYGLKVGDEDDDGPNEVLSLFGFLTVVAEREDLRVTVAKAGAIEFIKKYLNYEDIDLQWTAVQAWMALATCNLNVTVPQAVRMLAVDNIKARVSALEGLLKLMRDQPTTADLVFATFPPLLHCVKSPNKSIATHATLLLAALAIRSEAHATKLVDTPTVVPLVLAALRGSDMVHAKGAIEVLVSLCGNRSLKRRLVTDSSLGVVDGLLDALALSTSRHPAITNIHFSALLCLRFLTSGLDLADQALSADTLVHDKKQKGLKSITQFVFTAEEKIKMEAGRLLLYLAQYTATRNTVLTNERALVMMCAVAHMTALNAGTPNAQATQFLIRVEVLQAFAMWLDTHSELMCKNAHYVLPVLSAMSGVLNSGVAIRPATTPPSTDPAVAAADAKSAPATAAGAAATTAAAATAASGTSAPAATPTPGGAYINPIAAGVSVPVLYTAVVTRYLTALNQISLSLVPNERKAEDLTAALIQLKEMELHDLKSSATAASAKDAKGAHLVEVDGDGDDDDDDIDPDDVQAQTARAAKAAKKAEENAIGAHHLNLALTDEKSRLTSTQKLPIPVATRIDEALMQLEMQCAIIKKRGVVPAAVAPPPAAASGTAASGTAAAAPAATAAVAPAETEAELATRNAELRTRVDSIVGVALTALRRWTPNSSTAASTAAAPAPASK